MKPKIVNVEIYRCSVVFLIETTQEEWSKWYRAHKAQITESDNQIVLGEYNAEAPGFCFGTEGHDYICMIGNKEQVGLVAHEIFHAADSILFDHGYKLNGADEPMAYLIEYLTYKFYELIDKK